MHNHIMNMHILFPITGRLPLKEKFRAAAASGQVVMARPAHLPALIQINPFNDNIHHDSADRRDPNFPPFLSATCGTALYFLRLDPADCRIIAAATLYPKDGHSRAFVLHQVSTAADRRNQGLSGSVIAGLTEFFNQIPDLPAIYLTSYEPDGQAYLPRRIRTMARAVAPCPVLQYNRRISDYIQIRI